MSWYLCNSDSTSINVLAKVDYDGLFSPHPFKWSCAIEEHYMERILEEKKMSVIFYQQEFNFND